MSKLLISIPLFSLLLLINFNAISQNAEKETKRLKYFELEVGNESFDSEIPKYDFIRGDIDYFGAGTSADHIEGFCTKWYVGIKTEIRSKSNKFGLSGGIRYSHMGSSFGKDSYWGNSNDYFYLLLNQNETSTEFLKINEVNQTSNHLSVPIELKFFPFGERLFRLYFKLGVEFNYLINTNMEVEFDNKAMDQYESDVLSKFSETDNVYTAFYGVAGWSINLQKGTILNIEAVVPSLVANNYTTGLLSPSVGGGVKLSIQLPY